MVNLQDFIGNSESIKKFEIEELLLVEFKCPTDSSRDSLWWHNNFFCHVLYGETMLQTPRNNYVLKAGDSVFAKKGSVISHGEPHEEFCELVIFVPDDFIRSVIQKYKIPLGPPAGEQSDTVIPLFNDDLLTNYFQSLFTYFNLPKAPPESLLKIKFEELVVSILSSSDYAPLRCYFSEICAYSKPSIKAIMEANFSQNLSLEEFARLCARSLTAFKEEFKTIFQTTPGRWLHEKRREYSRYLLETTDHTLDDICYMSGFENSTHFIRVFKSKYGLPPGKFRMEKSTGVKRKTLPTS
jgi:AraC-like DNA-binding protein